MKIQYRFRGSLVEWRMWTGQGWSPRGQTSTQGRFKSMLLDAMDMGNHIELVPDSKE